jgi:hypothetical protein
MDAYQRALERDMIAMLRQHVKEWREGTIRAEDAMCDLRFWVDEIWGDEK